MEQGKKILPISVNLSRTSTLHGEIAERYFQIVKENGIPCSSVPIELTETATLNKDNMLQFEESTKSLNEWVRKQRNFVDEFVTIRPFTAHS